MLCLTNYVSSARDFALAEQRSYYDFGDSAGFLIWIVPVLLACLLANIVWVSKVVLAVFRSKSFRPAIACAVVVSLWVVVVLVTRDWATLPPNLALQPTHASYAGAVG